MDRDVNKIVSDAVVDYYNEDYVSAHEKYEWFFENGEKIKPSMRGVRVSFCLRGWVDVANEYPPAMKRIIEIKQDALTTFYEQQSIDAFRDFSCISRYLKTGNEVLDIFFKYHKSDKEIANNLFRHAFEFLVDKKDWEICAEYMEDFSRRYDICFQVFDKSSKTDCKLEKEELEMLYQDSIERLKKGLVPLFNIMLLKPDPKILDQYVGKVKTDLEARNLNGVYEKIRSLIAKNST